MEQNTSNVLSVTVQVTYLALNVMAMNPVLIAMLEALNVLTVTAQEIESALIATMVLNGTGNVSVPLQFRNI